MTLLANIFVGSLLGLDIRNTENSIGGIINTMGRSMTLNMRTLIPLIFPFFVEFLAGLKPITAYMKYKSRLKGPLSSIHPGNLKSYWGPVLALMGLLLFGVWGMGIYFLS